MPDMVVNITNAGGINRRILATDLPPYLFRNIKNYRISKTIGRFERRDGYGIIETDLPSSSRIFEFLDSAQNRVLILDGFKKKIWNGAGYDPIANINQSQMPSPSSIFTFYPVKHNAVVYAGAGTAADAYPYFIDYISDHIIYVKGFAETVTGNELFRIPAQNTDKIKENFSFGVHPVPAPYPDTYTMVFPKGRYQFMAVPIFINGDYGSPFSIGDITTLDQDEQYISIIMSTKAIYDVNAIINLVGFDIFMSYTPENVQGDFPYYFLERIDFQEEYGDVISTHIGNFVNDATYGLSLQLTHATNDITYGLTHLFLFTENGDILEIKSVITDTSGADTEVFITFYDDITSLVGQTDVYCEIKGKMGGVWGSSSDMRFGVIYDDYYQKPSTELYTYLGIPAGETEIKDYRYEFSAIAGNRLFTFRRDSIYAYYSPPDRFNVFTYANEIILKDFPTAVVNYKDGIIVFNKIGAELIRIGTNGEVFKDDIDFRYGAVSQDGVLSISSDDFFVMSLSGLWRVNHKISEDIQGEVESTVSLNSLSEDEILAGKIFYNQKNREIWFYFNSAQDGHIAWVYDLVKGAWIYFDFGVEIHSSIINNDGHQLAAIPDNLADFDGNLTNEQFTTELDLKVFVSEIIGKRLRLDKLLVKNSDNQYMNLIVKIDGFQLSNVQLNAIYEAYVRGIGEEIEVKITTPSLSVSHNIDHIQLFFQFLKR